MFESKLKTREELKKQKTVNVMNSIKWPDMGTNVLIYQFESKLSTPTQHAVGWSLMSEIANF